MKRWLDDRVKCFTREIAKEIIPWYLYYTFCRRPCRELWVIWQTQMSRYLQTRSFSFWLFIKDILNEDPISHKKTRYEVSWCLWASCLYYVCTLATCHCLWWWFSVHWTISNKFLGNFNHNTQHFFKNAFENVLCQMASILFRPLWVSVICLQWC